MLFSIILLIIQKLSKEIRQILGIEEPYWNRSITLPHRSELGLILEKRAFTGHKENSHLK